MAISLINGDQWWLILVNDAYWILLMANSDYLDQLKSIVTPYNQWAGCMKLVHIVTRSTLDPKYLLDPISFFLNLLLLPTTWWGEKNGRREMTITYGFNPTKWPKHSVWTSEHNAARLGVHKQLRCWIHRTANGILPTSLWHWTTLNGRRWKV